MANNPIPPLVCPVCGTHIENRNAQACPHCGSDERTGWGDIDYEPAADIPTGWSDEDDFSYEEFLEKEFNIPQTVSTRVWLKKMAVGVFILFLIIYLMR